MLAHDVGRDLHFGLSILTLRWRGSRHNPSEREWRSSRWAWMWARRTRLGLVATARARVL